MVLRAISLRDQLQQHPDRVLRAAVWGMLPHNRMGRALLKRLKIYAGPNHPHATNNPEPLLRREVKKEERSYGTIL